MTFSERSLSPINLDPLLQRLEGLFLGLAAWFAEDKLAFETPFGGDLPFALDTAINQGVVVLEVTTQALKFKGCPDWGLGVSLIDWTSVLALGRSRKPKGAYLRIGACRLIVRTLKIQLVRLENGGSGTYIEGIYRQTWPIGLRGF